MSVVQTVTGPVRAEDLGVTQMHEHLASDLRMYVPEDLDEERRREPLGPANRYDIGTHLRNEDVLRIDDVEGSADELDWFARAGGRTVVDVTSIGIGRSPQTLAALSTRTGVQVVMGTGWYVAASMSEGTRRRPEESLAEEIESDLTVGVADTGIRAGLIGEVGLSWPHHPAELRSLRAACRAQRRTGVALQIHPGRHPDSPRAAMAVVEDAGGDPTRTVICHVERTLTSVEAMIELARTGCLLEFDLFGQESSYYFVPEFTGMPNDAGRVRYIRALMEVGLGDRILVSQDICTKIHLRRYGGEGLHHLLHRVVPLMQRMGMSPSEIDQLLVANPARTLAGSISSTTASHSPEPISGRQS